MPKTIITENKKETNGISGLNVTLTKINTQKENEYLIHLINNTAVLETLGPLIKPQYFVSRYGGIVASIILDFHHKYKKSPGIDITLFYDSEVKSKKNYVHSATEEWILDKFIRNLSKTAEGFTEFSSDMIIDRCYDWICQRDLELHQEEIESLKQNERYQEASELTDAYRKPSITPQNYSPGITLRELGAKKFAPVDYLVEGLLPVGFNALGARMKFGKSNFCYNLVLSVLRGEPFLGRFPVQQGKVLLIDLENGEQQFWDIFNKILMAQDLQDDMGEWRDNIIIQTRDTFPIHSKSGVSLLEHIVRENPDIKLVILDIWKLFCEPRPDKGLFNYDRDYKEVGLVKDIAAKHGLCIMANVHLNQSWKDFESPFSAIWGSTGFVGACDNLYVMTSSDGEADAILHIVGKQIDNRKIALEKDAARRRWNYLGDAEEFEMTMDQNIIYQVLKESDVPMTPKEIAETIRKDSNNVSEMLRRMLKLGKVQRVGYGKYTIPRKINYNSDTTSPTSNRISLYHKDENLHESNMGTPTSPTSYELGNEETYRTCRTCRTYKEGELFLLEYFDTPEATAALDKAHEQSWRASLE